MRLERIVANVGREPVRSGANFCKFRNNLSGYIYCSVVAGITMNSDNDNEDAAAIAALMVVLSYGKLLLEEKKAKRKVRKRRWWVRMLDLHLNRFMYSGLYLLSDMRYQPSGKFENFCRMSADDFDFLLTKVESVIAKLNTNMRQAVPAKERLAATLRFLATGDSYRSLGYLFKMSPQIISTIIPEVCQALIDALKDSVKMRINELFI